MLSAMHKINVSGLNIDEKKQLKAIVLKKSNLRRQIEEDDQCGDDLMREYLSQGTSTTG